MYVQMFTYAKGLLKLAAEGAELDELAITCARLTRFALRLLRFGFGKLSVLFFMYSHFRS